MVTDTHDLTVRLNSGNHLAQWGSNISLRATTKRGKGAGLIEDAGIQMSHENYLAKS